MGTTGKRARRPRALIVDDHPDTRDLYKYHLRASGWEAQGVETGAEVPLAAAIFHPDVIVMDLAMPGVDGFEAMRHLKLDPRTTGIPVVVLTGHGTHENVEKAKRTGAEAVLTKPFPPDDLRHVLERMVSPPPTPKRRKSSPDQ